MRHCDVKGCSLRALVSVPELPALQVSKLLKPYEFLLLQKFATSTDGRCNCRGCSGLLEKSFVCFALAPQAPIG